MLFPLQTTAPHEAYALPPWAGGPPLNPLKMGQKSNFRNAGRLTSNYLQNGFWDNRPKIIPQLAANCGGSASRLKARSLGVRWRPSADLSFYLPVSATICGNLRQSAVLRNAPLKSSAPTGSDLIRPSNSQAHTGTTFPGILRQLCSRQTKKRFHASRITLQFAARPEQGRFFPFVD